MSAAPLRAPRTTPERRTERRSRPRLRIVRAPAPARTRVPFILACAAILVGAMLGSLMLNTMMATTSYQIHAQQLELAKLSQREAELAAQVDQLSSPAALAARAAQLGMVKAAGLSFISLADGTVLGPAAPKKD